MVYYLSKLIAEQIRRGQRYEKLCPVYCVAICGFTILPGDTRYIHRFSLREEVSGEVFTDLQNMIIIELPKVPEKDDGNRAWPVLKCFRCKTIEEAEMHAKAYPEIKEIVAELRGFSLVKEIRSAYEAHQKAWRDREMWKSEYREQGADRERKKWESEKEMLQSKNEAAVSVLETENEALRRELERLRREGGLSV
jgi:predicted transposase/invertase (TIGR01784 family)